MKKSAICNMDCLNCIHPDCINDRVPPNYYQLMKANKPDAYRRRVDAIKAYVSARYYERKKAGICVGCGKVKVTSGVQCEACAERSRQYSRKYKKKRKAEAV